MIIAVALSIVVLFCVFSFNGAVEKYLTSVETASCGNADISITPKSDSAKISSLNEAKSVEGVEYAVGILNFYGESDGTYLNLVGLDKNDFELLHTLDVVSGSKEELFSNAENVAISVKTAKDMNLSVGDEIEISVFGRTNKFYVSAICKQTGYFAEDNPAKILGHNAGGMARLIGISLGGIYNKIFVKVEKGFSVSSVVDNIKATETYGKMTVKESVDYEYINQQSKSYGATVVIGGIAIAILIVGAIVILYMLSSEEKRILISKLTAIGATKRQLVGLFMTENGFISLTGLLLGLCLAPLGLFILLKATISEAVFSVNAGLLIGAGILIAAISFAAGFLPYLISKRKSSRENLISEKGKGIAEKIITCVLISVVVALTFTMFFAKSPTSRGVAGIINVVAIALATCFLAPHCVKLFGKIFKKSKNPSVYIAGNNLSVRRTSRGIKLLTLGVSVGILLTLSYTVTKAVFSDFKKDYSDLIFVTNISSDTSADYDRVAAVGGVDKVSKAIWLKGEAEIVGNKKSVNVIGVDDVFEIIDFRFKTDKSVCLQRLNDEEKNYCLIDYAYSVLYGLKEGDVISISFENKTATFTIGGIVRQELFGGAYIVAGRKNLSAAMGISGYDTIVAKAVNADKVAKEMQASFSVNNLFVLTALETFSWESESFDNIFNLIGSMAILFILAISASVVVNVVIARGTAKNERSQLLLLGTIKKDLLLSEWLEYFIVALVSFIVAMAFSALHIASLIYALLLFDLYFEFYYVAWVAFTVSGLMCGLYALLPFIFCFKKGYGVKGVNKE